MTMNILHVGLGPLGRKIVSDLHTRGLGRVTAAVDRDASLTGHPLSELAPGANEHVRVVGSLEDVPSSGRFDAVIVTTSSSLRSCADTFRELMHRGLTVVSSCEELLWPSLRAPELTEELDRLARDHGGRLLGTGVNPGFVMDLLPAVLSGVCHEIRGVRVSRVQDATTRRLPFQAKIGASLTRDEFERRARETSIRHVGLGESLHLLASALGQQIEDWDETIGPVIATRPMSCGLGEIPEGHCAGVEQTATGTTDRGLKLELRFVASIGQPDPADRVQITGTPDLELVIPGAVHGDVATSAIVLNSIAALSKANPGLHTMLSVPAVTHSVG